MKKLLLGLMLLVGTLGAFVPAEAGVRFYRPVVRPCYWVLVNYTSYQYVYTAYGYAYVPVTYQQYQLVCY